MIASDGGENGVGAAREVPEDRVRAPCGGPVRPHGAYVLYWMTAFRRLEWNFALQRAVERARALDRPLVILEALRVDYPWASWRTHAFVMHGMADHAERLAPTRVRHHPYVEPEAGAGSGLLEALARDACLVVGDDYPGFFLPRMVEAAAQRLDVRLELVDGNGLLPLRSAGRAFARAYDLRRFLHCQLPPHLGRFPREHPLVGDPLQPAPEISARIRERWPAAPPAELREPERLLQRLPIDRQPGLVAYRGGPAAGGRAVERFLDERLERYAEERNEPGARATSRLSPYLHFGHVSSHGIFKALAEREAWGTAKLGEPTGKRTGWWGMSESAEAFLDELVTWRELGYLAAVHEEGHDRYASLPDWARDTLARHAHDPRDPVYPLERFEAADTHDPLWNAAQSQLREEGRIHNYMRMLWGKKILHWSESPERAFAIMVELNNRYGVDGRDPNSYSGILWILGKYDRPWGPERPIFGKVRYMTSESTARKYDVDPYLARWSGGAR